MSHPLEEWSSILTLTKYSLLCLLPFTCAVLEIILLYHLLHFQYQYYLIVSAILLLCQMMKIHY